MSLLVYKLTKPAWQVANRRPPTQYAIADPFTKDILIFNKDSLASPLFYGDGDREMAWTWYQMFTSQGFLTSWLDLLVVRGIGEEQATKMFNDFRKPSELFETPDF
jgi:hypothetical protein